MERHEFLSKLGIGVVAVCAGYSLVPCSSKSGNPTPWAEVTINGSTLTVSA